jgi:hypothetical protein
MSNVAQLRPLARVHARLREQLQIAYGLDGDDEALRDTLDGESDFKDECVFAMRQAQQREDDAAGCDARIEKLELRKARLLAGSNAIRAAIREAMLEAGERKITAPDMTLSARVGKPHLLIDDEKLPAAFRIPKTTVTADRAAIKDAVDRGEVPEGVQITNGNPILTVTTR